MDVSVYGQLFDDLALSQYRQPIPAMPRQQIYQSNGATSGLCRGYYGISSSLILSVKASALS